MPEITLEKIRSLWQSNDEIKRRGRVSDLLQMYGSDWSDLLDLELRKLFIPQNYDKLALRADTSMNILKWAVDTLGAIYSRPVHREINSDSTPFERFKDMDLALDGACRLLYLCREIFIRPLVMDDGSIILDIMTPDKVCVIPSKMNPWHVDAIIYSIDSGNKYVVWTSESHLVLTSEFERIEQEDNPNDINPYGRIPWVALHARYPVRGSFFNDLESEALKQATLATGISMTDHSHLRHLQSFKQLVFTGMTDEAAVRAMVDPASAISIKNPNAEVSVVDMQADLKSHLSTIIDAASATLNFMGIRPEMVRGTLSASSGYALSIMMHETERAWESQRQIWRVYEQMLFDMASLVLQTDIGIRLPEGDVLVTYGDLRPENSPKEEADYYIQLVNNHLISRKTAMMRLFDMNEEQVEEEIDQIVQEKTQLSPLSIPPMLDSPELTSLNNEQAGIEEDVSLEQETESISGDYN